MTYLLHRTRSALLAHDALCEALRGHDADLRNRVLGRALQLVGEGYAEDAFPYVSPDDAIRAPLTASGLEYLRVAAGVDDCARRSGGGLKSGKRGQWSREERKRAVADDLDGYWRDRLRDGIEADIVDARLDAMEEPLPERRVDPMARWAGPLESDR